MKYMLMLYADEKVGAAIPAEDMAKAMQTLYAYREALTKARAFVATSALAPTWEAKTLRMEGGEVKQREPGQFVNEGGGSRSMTAPTPTRASSSVATSSSKPRTWMRR